MFHPLFSPFDNVEFNKQYKEFYDGNDYFFPAPIFQSRIEPLNFKIATPPSKEPRNRNPLLLTIIPSLLMCSSSLMMRGYIALKNLYDPQAGDYNMTTLVMCASMIVVSLIWPFIEKNNYYDV